MSANWQDIVAILIALACGAYTVRYFYRTVLKKNDCGCSGCPSGAKKPVSIQPLGRK